MQIEKHFQILKALGKRHHLVFDKEHKYCISGPYKNEKGEHIPNYLPYVIDGMIRAVYVLKYIDGCFHPFAYKLDKEEMTDKVKLYCNKVCGTDFFIPE